VMSWDESHGADGLFLDVAGCAHLYGGEAGLMNDLACRLRRFGLFPRLAIVDTAGAAWGIVRYGDATSMIVPSGGETEAIQDLPIAALRLAHETSTLLHRLGFRRIEDLMHKPRAPLAARFGGDLLHHLDQALGREPEPLSPVHLPPRYCARMTFAEPIITEEHVLTAARHLLCDLALQLAQDCVGARRLRLLLFRVDGEMQSLDLGLAASSRDAEHLARLMALRLERLSAGLESDFGFDAAAMHVLMAEPMRERQALLSSKGDAQEELTRLFDCLEQRLGAGSVQRLRPHQSHIPERAVSMRPATDGPMPDWTAAERASARPLFLLPCPEEVSEVMALIPEGPPRRFRWRRVLHQVTHAEGPERIAPEWWRQAKAETERDYYVVEDESGRRFWLYRAGLYRDGTADPRWFVHGVFA
jgi:protein ImuB